MLIRILSGKEVQLLQLFTEIVAEELDMPLYKLNLLRFADFPFAQLWRFIVEGALQEEEKGWGEYEKREPGSVSAAINGLTRALHNLSDTTLSVDLIQSIYQVCSRVDGADEAKKDVFRGKQVGVQCGIPAESRTPKEIINFLFETPRYGIQGFLALIKESKGGEVDEYGDPIWEPHPHRYNYFQRSDCGSCVNQMLTNKPILAYIPPQVSDSRMKEVMEEIADDYNKPKGDSTCDCFNCKIKDIVILIQELTRLHPYIDFNNRLFVNCLLFRLLLQRDVIPPLFFQPNIFEFHDINALCGVIEKGIQFTEALINEPKKKLFGLVCGDEIEDKLKESITAFMNKLVLELHKKGANLFREKSYQNALLFLEKALSLEKKVEKSNKPQLIKCLFSVGLVASNLEGGNERVRDIIKELAQLRFSDNETEKSQHAFLNSREKGNDELSQSIRKLEKILENWKVPTAACGISSN